MVGFDRNASAANEQGVVIDEGLKAYMMRVYNYMSAGLAITGVVSYLTSTSETMLNAIFGTPLQWVVMLAPLGFIIFLNFKIEKLSMAKAQMVFWAFAGAMGLSLSYIFLLYTGESIVRIFFITSSVFGAMSLYGYTTKKDLTGMGSFLMMGLIGVIIASIVNIFIGSTALQFAVSVLCVLIFTGLTAYDTQRIKQMYYSVGAGQLGKAALMGALSLYLDFINLFIHMLHLFGSRR